jgi:hypothetical protein
VLMAGAAGCPRHCRGASDRAISPASGAAEALGVRRLRPVGAARCLEADQVRAVPRCC